MVGRWETMDRTLDGRWSHVGQPAFDAYLRSELELAIETAGSHGARVLLATAPYNRRGEQLDGSLFPEDHPERVTDWNALLRDVAADHRDVGVVEFGARITPDGEFTWTAGGVQVRSDGVHLTPSGVQEWIAPWLFPQLVRAVGVGDGRGLSARRSAQDGNLDHPGGARRAGRLTRARPACSTRAAVTARTGWRRTTCSASASEVTTPIWWRAPSTHSWRRWRATPVAASS